MYCIVPLAGPDFWLRTSVLETALKSRPWSVSGENTIFVVRQTPYTETVAGQLSGAFPGCKIVVVPGLTQGALLTSVAAVSMIADFDAPICVDLADILYDMKADITPMLESSEVGGMIPYFPGNSPKYSYLRIENGAVTETREKEIISPHASAGTYWFRNLPVFLDAVSASVADPSRYTVNGLHFLCPSYNGLIAKGWKILPLKVTLIQCLSTTILR